MRATSDPLTAAMEGLELAVSAGTVNRGRDWAGWVDRCLGDVERALRMHCVAVGSDDGPVADLDRPLIPSPGVDRHTADLRRELEELLKETASLRARVRGAAPGDGHAVDLTSFRDRVARLVEALGRYEEKEVALIQQAVCTDIGAGD